MNFPVMLEWFLNPDHLPFIIALEKGLYKSAGLEVELIQPEDHYDGFDLLEKGEVRIAVNEPIHLFEHYRPGLVDLGNFFATDGGVMFTREGYETFRRGEPVRVTTPAANHVTNKVAREILRRYREKRGYPEGAVEFVQTDFRHLKHLKAGFDAAWLCFANFEGVEARLEGLETVMVDHRNAGYPNFSALDLIADRNRHQGERERYDAFLKATASGLLFAKTNPGEAAELYYRHAGETPSPLMDAIIKDSIPRLRFPMVSSARTYEPLYTFLESLGLSVLTPKARRNLFLEA